MRYNESMRILCIGDIHAKTWLVPKVASLAPLVSIEKIVFLGDYLDDWNAGPADNELTAQQLVGFSKNTDYDSIFLWGNHDLSNILRGEFICSGYRAVNVVAANIIDKLPLQFAFGVDNYIFTHAGITKKWLKSVGLEVLNHEDSGEQLAEKINSLSSVCFNRTGPMRGGVDDPSPVWTDLAELSQDIIPYVNQVVGHTPVFTCHEQKFKRGRYYACDTFSTYPDGTDYGDSSVIVIDTTKHTMEKYNLLSQERIK